MATAATSTALAEYLRANSYARVPNQDRQEEGWSAYKKGYELRIVVKTQEDVRKIRRLLQDLGIQPGKPFRKAQQWVQPVYGRQAVKSLIAIKGKKRASRTR